MKRMGGANGRQGGVLSGAARSRAAARSAIRVRSVSVPPKRSKSMATASDGTYELVNRAMAEKDAAVARMKELAAELKKAQRANKALTRQLAQDGQLPASMATAPSRTPLTIRTSSQADRETVSGVKRGDVLEVQPKAKYRLEYDMICQTSTPSGSGSWMER